MNEYMIYTGEGYTQNPAGDDVENFQVLGVACKGKTAADAIATLAEEFGSGEPDGEADAGVLGFDMGQARAVQTITEEQKGAIRLILATHAPHPDNVALVEAVAVLRKMAEGFTD
ncbi:MAG: hypothetical protein IKZ87_01635 [Actinomycetaceae bacterium]|nr:hypothetical protein [Actinomycetaceae bacterium]